MWSQELLSALVNVYAVRKPEQILEIFDPWTPGKEYKHAQKLQTE